MTASAPPPAVVVMGVSGSGKTTVGRELARLLHATFVDADDLHPPSNRDKMAGGTPLTDDDRAPWLRMVGRTIRDQLDGGRGVVVACSALRRHYRDAIADEAGAPVAFAHLAGRPELIRDRLDARAGHFMPPGLLTSQLETLEPLEPGEHGAAFAIDADPADLAARIRDWATAAIREEAPA